MKIHDPFDTLVIGSGCAGYSAADCLWDQGVRSLAILTENRLLGTSRNTGSDKQTYYKMSLGGNEGDCPAFMAQTLFDGGAMDGDTALIEAANSVKAFLKLESLGVSFPQNAYGEFAGYKTDHDPYSRASSVGPYTSREMTEALEKSVMGKHIPVLSGFQAIRLSVDQGRIRGVYALDCSRLEDDFGLVFFPCQNVVVATGGPAICYRDSVFPRGHTGASSLLLEAGVRFANAAEWQYGIASTKFRWNLSGSYQQVLPRYYSVDGSGQEHEFLSEAYEDPAEAVSNIFLKGYQWPFDSKKVTGSSRIDLLVYAEIALKKRRVYMDFRRNPSVIDKKGLACLCKEGYDYLQNCQALQQLPIQRLLAMNPKAYSLYLDHGIDLKTEPLEIAVCAQHNNGGAEVNANYETNIRGVFAAGEAACTLGILRPGGTALNSTQVSGLRIAQCIAGRKPDATAPLPPAAEAAAIRDFILASQSDTASILPFRKEMQSLMTEHFAFRREITDMEQTIPRFRESWDTLTEKSTWTEASQLPQLFKNRDMLATQLAYASSILHTAKCAGSRGGAVVTKNGAEVSEDTAFQAQKILTAFDNGNVTITQRPVRPLPVQRDLWFETVWKEHLSRKGQ